MNYYMRISRDWTVVFLKYPYFLNTQVNEIPIYFIQQKKSDIIREPFTLALSESTSSCSCSTCLLVFPFAALASAAWNDRTQTLT